VQVYMYTPPPPTVAMWSPPRTMFYPSAYAYRAGYGYGY
jgi:hypothetical protein